MFHYYLQSLLLVLRSVERWGREMMTAGHIPLQMQYKHSLPINIYQRILSYCLNRDGQKTWPLYSINYRLTPQKSQRVQCSNTLAKWLTSNISNHTHHFCVWVHHPYFSYPGPPHSITPNCQWALLTPSHLTISGPPSLHHT